MQVLTDEALEFVAKLHEAHAARRDELLALRQERRPLGFLADTQHVRDGEWQVAAAPEPLRDRRVEITGPTERKMTINALNSGAKVWLADLEDANTPHWDNVVQGQVNLYEAARETIEYSSPEGKEYRLKGGPYPTIVVRPRGWHLDERNLQFGGKNAVGALVDFGLHFFHNAELGRPYYYLPKMESHLEARLWNDVFTTAQKLKGVPYGTIRATVLIETIPAAFEMEEILYELRDHASGLNAGRWDYLFSVIKYFRDAGADYVLPDRNSVTMTAPFMRAYTELLVKTCHKRGAFAMGGMAGLNRVMLLGNLGADPELRMTSGGQAVLKLRLATSETYLDRNKVRQERTEWHSVIVWGRRGEALAKILAKGSRIFVEGGLRTSSYDDKEGHKRYKTEVVANNIILSGGGRGGGAGGGPRHSEGPGGADDDAGPGPGGGGGGGGGGGFPDSDYGGGGDDEIPF